MRGFMGPRDIFRNPESMFRQFEKTSGDSPFDLVLSHSGSDFAVMGMHFKLGLYEHQSAGALQGLLTLIRENPQILEKHGAIAKINIVAYEPAFGIIGDPAKRDPKTRQSADHSMVYIVSTLLRKAIEMAESTKSTKLGHCDNCYWKNLMLVPHDYAPDAIVNKKFDSGLVMYPAGHARNATADLKGILARKAQLLGALASDAANPIIDRFNRVGAMSTVELAGLYDFAIADRGQYE